MYNLCEDTIRVILNYLEFFEDTYNILTINKQYFKLTKAIYNKLYNLYLHEVVYKYPMYIQNIFVNIAYMRNIPTIDYKDSYKDIFGCINNIKLIDINFPITKCIDNYNRIFLILKLKMKILDKRGLYNNIVTPISVYQNTKIYPRWVIGSNDNYYNLVFNNIINEKDTIILKRLLSRHTIQYNGCIISI